MLERSTELFCRRNPPIVEVRTGDQFARLLEKTLLVVGVSLIVIYGGARLFQSVSSQNALASFDQVLAAGESPENRPSVLVSRSAQRLQPLVRETNPRISRNSPN